MPPSLAITEIGAALARCRCGPRFEHHKAVLVVCGIDGDRVDDRGIDRFADLTRSVVFHRYVGERLADVVAGDELADDRVLVVAVAERGGRNEELAIVGVGTAVRQSQEAGGGVSDINVEFVVLHGPFRAVGTAAAAAGARRIAALNHEILDDAVKSQTVVEIWSQPAS